MGVLSNLTDVAVHNGWASYAGYGERHGLCNAHHLREPRFLWEEGRQRQALALARELRRWKCLVDPANERERDHLAAATVRKIEQRHE